MLSVECTFQLLLVRLYLLDIYLWDIYLLTTFGLQRYCLTTSNAKSH